jgi:para-aminobenzoate synthetase/4-amino-4-deoxychorismate lyase
MNRWHSPPAELYALVEHTPATVLLEDAESAAAKPYATEPRAGNSRVFTAPLRILIANESAELPNLFAEIERAVAAGHDAAGFFTYECAHFFEPTVPIRPGQLPAQPLAWIGIYDRCYSFDHRTGSFPGGDPPALEQFHAATSPPQPSADPQLKAALALTELQYAERIAAIHEWIRAGDVYQLNFTVPMKVHAPGSSAALYQRLRSRQPVPYGAFLHTQPGRRILSFSPELFFRVDHDAATRRITTRPMKGTAPRGRTNREDHDLAGWLSNDPKNRSENVMIVDLLRNDLGRLSNYGSVRAENLFSVERYPTLLQMTSTVTGELRPGSGFQEIFRALFPCGSVTGAPKVRAMQLIAAIEDQPRGVYTGAIGFFSRELTVFNVAIRTLVLEGQSLEGQSWDLNGQHGTMGIGSGIVIDSDPAAEFRECLLKAEFLTRASSPPTDAFSLIETLLWNGEFPLIKLHLDRLEDSAHFFGFPFERATAQAALLTRAASFSKDLCAPSIPHLSAEWVGSQESQRIELPRKVRLLLDRDGNLKIESELLPASAITGHAQPARVRIAPQRTDPGDPMYFHKTTHRPLYAEALKVAVDAGFDDVLFLNLRGEVTECAIHNVFVEKDGCLFTPPVECGLLPGVHRRHLLETRPSTTERVLYPEDLRHADAIFLSNAVRGLRPATIDWEDKS